MIRKRMPNGLHASRILAVLLLAGLFGGVQAESGQPLNAEQIALLVLASREQYRTFETLTIHSAYILEGDKQVKSVDSRTLLRMAGPRSYARMEATEYGPNPANPDVNETRFTREFATTSQWSKMMTQSPDRVRGIVDRTSLREIGLTVADALWGLHGQDWTIFRDSDATCKLDEKSGHYILEARFGRPADSTNRIVAEIDPDKGFLPAKIMAQSADGKVLMTVENSEFRQLPNGLWLPHKYTLSSFGDFSAMEVYQVEEARVNIEIPDDQLDFVFPDGTIVQDRIARLRYVVDQPASNESLPASADKVTTIMGTSESPQRKSLDQAEQMPRSRFLLLIVLGGTAGVVFTVFLGGRLIRRAR